MLNRPLSLFEKRFKTYVVQTLYHSDNFIDDMLLPPDTASMYFVNLLSYIYPALPSKVNRLPMKTVWNNKYFSGLYRRLREQEIAPYQCTFRSLWGSMGIKDPDNVMNLYRIILVADGFDFAVKGGRIL